VAGGDAAADGGGGGAEVGLDAVVTSVSVAKLMVVVREYLVEVDVDRTVVVCILVLVLMRTWRLCLDGRRRSSE
jgi:hypothetical protein